MMRPRSHSVPLLHGLLAWTALCFAGVYAASAPTSVTILGKNPVVVKAHIVHHGTVSRLAVSTLEFITRSNGTIVRFKVSSDAMLNLPRVAFQRPLVKDHEVHVPNGGILHEPVVMLNVCVAGQYLHNVPFILVRQNGFTPPMRLEAQVIPKKSSTQKVRHGTNRSLCRRKPSAA